jgi:D-alanine-D-alanine ligase
MSKRKVAVIYGGPSTEADVSRASADGVLRALAEAGHDAVGLVLDAALPEALRRGAFDVAFPVAHGAVGEDGALQGVFEVLALPYVGSDVLASACAMNKPVARMLFAAAGLPVAPGIALSARAFTDNARAAAAHALRAINGGLVVKPGAHGSAIGVARFEATAPEAAVADAIASVWRIDRTALVEQFARGREVTCGVLDLHPTDPASADPIVAFPPTEVRAPKDAFYTFEARYEAGRSIHECPANLPEAVRARVQEIAVAAHRALGCRDLSRVDFIVGHGSGERDERDGPGAHVVTLLEVNTLPGFTKTSLYPEAAQVSGLSFAALCDALVESAHRRGPTPRNVSVPLPGAPPSAG